jgi:uncharacterized membrane protein YvbJ
LKCKKCGTEVSVHYSSCPKCGEPTGKGRSISTRELLLLLAFVFIVVMTLIPFLFGLLVAVLRRVLHLPFA